MILSAGAIGSPQLLLLSGIGNKTTLSQAPFGISSTLDLPDVGQHLQDHPQIPNFFLVNSNSTFDNVLRNAALANMWLNEWEEKRQGRAVPRGRTSSRSRTALWALDRLRHAPCAYALGILRSANSSEFLLLVRRGTFLARPCHLCFSNPTSYVICLIYSSASVNVIFAVPPMAMSHS